MDPFLFGKRILAALNASDATRDKLRKAVLMTRRLDPRERIKPDFLLIGAQKGGTSSVFLNLMFHPNIIPPLHKEIFYFNEYYDMGDNWYYSHFATRHEKKLLKKKVTGRCITGEATITYLCDPIAAERVIDHLPNAKLIAVLRDPVIRAHSHFKHAIRIKNETRDFATAVRTELKRLELGILKHEDPQVPYEENTQYLVRGRYAEQLEAWFEHFPREQMLVLRSEDYFANPGLIYQQITRFLGIPDWKPRKFEKINIAKNKVPFGKEEQILLREYFKPHNQKLNELMGRDFGWD